MFSCCYFRRLRSLFFLVCANRASVGSKQSLVYDIIFSSSYLLFRPLEMLKKLCRSWYKMAKTFQIKQQGQKLVHLRKELPPSDRDSETNIFDDWFPRGWYLGPLNYFAILSHLDQLCRAQKLPKIGIQVPSVGDDNRSCRILTVFKNKIKQWWIPQYTIYSSTLFYENVFIYTVLRGGSSSLFSSIYLFSTHVGSLFYCWYISWYECRIYIRNVPAWHTIKGIWLSNGNH